MCSYSTQENVLVSIKLSFKPENKFAVHHNILKTDCKFHLCHKGEDMGKEKLNLDEVLRILKTQKTAF